MALGFVGVPGTGVDVPIVYDPFTSELGIAANPLTPVMAYTVCDEETVIGPV